MPDNLESGRYLQFDQGEVEPMGTILGQIDVTIDTPVESDLDSRGNKPMCRTPCGVLTCS